jgi:crotonobetainyl-CoA:carnitine CoA-transferase CaiB-like acyl-CoA transferase
LTKAGAEDAAALAGLQVVDLASDVGGAWCARLLAAFGADVIRVEAPDGSDALRQPGPFDARGDAPETRALHLYLNAGKRSLALDTSAAAGRALLERLLARADVLVETLDPARRAALDLEPRATGRRHAALVQVSVVPFGLAGPYAGFRATPMISAALGGYMYLGGSPDRQPLANLSPQPDYMAGLHGFAGALVALRWRDSGGSGQHVEIAVQECMASIHQFTITRWVYNRRIQRRIGNRYQRSHPITIYRVADGLVSIAVANLDQYTRFLDVIGAAGLRADPRFADPFVCSEHVAAFDAAIAPRLREARKEALVLACQRQRVPAGFVNDLREILDDPQYCDRGFWATIDHPVAGPHLHAGFPVRMSGTPPAARRAPLLGEHDSAIRAESA